MLPHREGMCPPQWLTRSCTLTPVTKRMALNSFQLFLGQVQAAPEVLKTSVLHIVFDILMVHEGDFLGPGSANVGV